MRTVDASDRALLLVFDDCISLAAHRDVMRLTPLLQLLRGVTNVHPAYASILVDFDPRVVRHADIEKEAARLFSETAADPLPAGRTVEIPVVYGGGSGPDLEAVAALTSHTVDEVIALHSGADYLVYFLGFSPGFPYLGGMPASLATPRLESPRKSVPAGSVAIGGQQTGVYPMASPGGWRIVGRTALKLFDPSAADPVLLRMGDHVKFIPVREGAF